LITVKKEGFAFNSTYISANDTSFSSPKNLNIALESLEEGKSFSLSDIYFETNSFQINPMAKNILFEFSVYLKVNINMVIEINGFTDDVGGGDVNQLLSENRAIAVYDLLISNGIEAGRILFNGYGELFPVAGNTTEKGRARNRRTEFKIIRQ